MSGNVSPYNESLLDLNGELRTLPLGVPNIWSVHSIHGFLLKRVPCFKLTDGSVTLFMVVP
jgi:hypothetical protein